MDGVLDITDDLDVYVEEDNNNNLDAKEEEDIISPKVFICHSGFGTCATGTSPSPYFVT